mgnify:CR=1 FL=1
MSSRSLWNQSSKLLAAAACPNVRYVPTLKSPMSPLVSVLVPPMRLISFSKRKPAVSPPSPAVPAWTIASGPDCCIVSIIVSAICVSASSHDMRSHSPPPRAPLRRIGYGMRVGASSVRLQAAPFWQPIGFMSGTPGSMGGSVPDCSSRSTRPSLMYARKGQLPGEQFTQCVTHFASSHAIWRRYRSSPATGASDVIVLPPLRS